MHNGVADNPPVLPQSRQGRALTVDAIVSFFYLAQMPNICYPN